MRTAAGSTSDAEKGTSVDTTPDGIIRRVCQIDGIRVRDAM